MTSHSILRSIAEKKEVKRDIQHLVNPLLIRAALIVMLILVWGVGWRLVHVSCEKERQDVNSSR